MTTDAREARLAIALRTNLRRRKPTPVGAPHEVGADAGEPGSGSDDRARDGASSDEPLYRD